MRPMNHARRSFSLIRRSVIQAIKKNERKREHRGLVYTHNNKKLLPYLTLLLTPRDVTCMETCRTFLGLLRTSVYTAGWYAARDAICIILRDGRWLKTLLVIIRGPRAHQYMKIRNFCPKKRRKRRRRRKKKTLSAGIVKVAQQSSTASTRRRTHQLLSQSTCTVENLTLESYV